MPSLAARVAALKAAGATVTVNPDFSLTAVFTAADPWDAKAWVENVVQAAQSAASAAGADFGFAKPTWK